jgi:hypothetical protein
MPDNGIVMHKGIRMDWPERDDKETVAYEKVRMDKILDPLQESSTTTQHDKPRKPIRLIYCDPEVDNYSFHYV